MGAKGCMHGRFFCLLFFGVVKIITKYIIEFKPTYFILQNLAVSIILTLYINKQSWVALLWVHYRKAHCFSFYLVCFSGRGTLWPLACPMRHLGLRPIMQSAGTQGRFLCLSLPWNSVLMPLTGLWTHLLVWLCPSCEILYGSSPLRWFCALYQLLFSPRSATFLNCSKRN